MIKELISHKSLLTEWCRLSLNRANSLIAQLCNFDGATAVDVRAVTCFVLFRLQKPPRVRQTSDLHSSVTQRPQLLINVVQVYQNANAASTDERKSEAELLLARPAMVSGLVSTSTDSRGIQIYQEVICQNSPETSQDENLSLVQTFGQQLIYHLLDDQRAHECVTT